MLLRASAWSSLQHLVSKRQSKQNVNNQKKENTMSEQETIPQDNGNPSQGIVHSANESRFSASHYNEALTAFSSGYKDPENLGELLEFIAPAVPVGRRFEFKRANNAEAFLSETDDVRAIGSAFKRVEYTGESVNEKTLNKGLTIRVDHDEVVGDDWQERYVQLLIQRLHRNELRRAIAVLDGAAKSREQVWDAKSNPDADLRKALIEAADKSGIRPNRILFGEGAWDARATAYESKDHSAAIRSADMSLDDMSRKLLVDEAKVMRARYQTRTNGKAQMIGNSVYAYFAQNAVTKDEPSNLKRFVTPVDGGSGFRVYLEEHAKYTDISVEHYSNIVVTSDLGIQKVTIG